MTTEQKLKNLILSRYKSVREFSLKIKMPYSTVATIFSKGIEKTSVTTMIPICQELGISLDELVKGNIVFVDTEPRSTEVMDLVIRFKDQLISGTLTFNGQPYDQASAKRLAMYMDALMEAEKRNQENPNLNIGTENG